MTLSSAKYSSCIVEYFRKVSGETTFQFALLDVTRAAIISPTSTGPSSRTMPWRELCLKVGDGVFRRRFEIA